MISFATMILRTLCIPVIWMLAFGGCAREKTVTPGAVGPSSLIRLGERRYMTSTKLEPYLVIDPHNFQPYQGKGWRVSGSEISVMENSAFFSLRNPEHLPPNVSLKFRARSTGTARLLNILDDKKTLDSVSLHPEWGNYQVDLKIEDPGRSEIRQLEFSFSGNRSDSKSFADFQQFELPLYGWRKTKIGHTERLAFTVSANSRIIFPITLPSGNPHLFLGAGVPIEAGRTPVMRFRVAVNDGIHSTDLLNGIKQNPGWMDGETDLTSFAGKNVMLELETMTVRQEPSWVAWSSPEIYDLSAPRNHPNIILFSVDTLRPDRLSAYGYRRPTSPNLDSLARESSVFHNAYCTFPHTLPSHASVMTGLYPGHHQVAKPNDIVLRSKRIPAELVTLAELAHENRYFTTAITDGGYVSSIQGFDDGFQQYTENTTVVYRDEGANMDKAIQWIRKNSKRPFFLFLHTYRVHEPFEASREAFQHVFPEQMPKGNQPFRTSMSWLNKVVSGEVVPTKEDKEFVSRCYDAGIFDFDQKFGHFLAELKRLGLYQSTVLLLFGDHGEQLFDRDNLFGHPRTLYTEEIRVPLILHIPGKGYQKRNELVSLVDVYPTLAEIMGSTPHPPVDGISLLESADSRRRFDRFIYYEMIHDKEAEWGMQNDEWKLVFDIVKRKESLWNLRQDPGETRDVISAFLKPAQIMKALLSTYMKTSMTPNQAIRLQREPEETKELEKQLRALGYLN